VAPLYIINIARPEPKWLKLTSFVHHLEPFTISRKMTENEPPPPYSASPHVASPAGGNYGSSGATQRESTQRSFVHQPGTSRSSFNPLHSAIPTQGNSIRGFSPAQNSDYARAPTIAACTTHVGSVQPSSRSGTTQADTIRGSVSSAPSRLSGENRTNKFQPSVSTTPNSFRPTQMDSIQELTRQPGTYFDAKKNILIVPKKPAQPPHSFVQQSGVSSAFTQAPGTYFDAKKNILIIPRESANQSGTSFDAKKNILIVPKEPARLAPSFIQQSDVSNSFAVNAPPSFAEATSQGNHRFPKEFGFYKASTLISDMVIARRADDPNPLFYISTHSGLSSKPNIILHSTCYPSSPPLATANYHTYTSTIDIALAATSSYRAEHRSLEKTGVFSSGRAFSVTLAGSNVPESFEWKRSHGQEVANLHGRGHGEKLVRINTGEVVAAWTTPYMSIGKKGKMSFLGNRDVLGEKFELMAVICMLGIMGKDHNGKHGGGAGMMGGGGAIGGASGAF
jgi:hypothetical protein